MFAVRACLYRTASSNKSLINISKSFSLVSKTLTSLNVLNAQALKICKGAQSFKIFIKPQVKLDWLSRKATAVAPAQVSVGLIRKQVGIWLSLCSGMVYVAIVLGGYTRLTESGLSMVTWRFTYESFPKTDEEWITEFEKYKQYPEFKLLKKDITLEEFRTIFTTEYLHRNWGRCLGLVFLFPAISFWLRGGFRPAMKKRVLFFGALIAAQGFLGWYMVKSGLEDRFNKETDVPRVSQYRLAAHLGLALTLYTGLVLTAFDLLLPSQKAAAAASLVQGIRKLRILVHSCKGLVFLTALSGAFVAGLDAGLVYNSFPKMGDNWIPDDILALTPKYMNFTENPTTVQFDHRILGVLTFSAIMAMWFLCKRHSFPKRAKLAADTVALAAIGQVLLGISTLVHYVPSSLALSHQSGSVVLLTATMWLSHELKLLKYVPK